jgi:hypothetical protein
MTNDGGCYFAPALGVNNDSRVLPAGATGYDRRAREETP